ncbi:cytochrome [Serratia marcescens]|uniref:cytochrome n=1 Tax=Serratia marcescens TaxID=615 RepID=UPI001F14E2F6|nr:cytochrome [Serratia marcescens]MDP8728362.1 cytochrome [Serratia marcescens]
MNFTEMFAALAPKKKEILINGFKFYARPMTVAEFQEHMTNENKNERDALMIFKCISDENNKPVFESVDQIKALYSNVQLELAQACADMSIFLPPREVEKSVKQTGQSDSDSNK